MKEFDQVACKGSHLPLMELCHLHGHMAITYMLLHPSKLREELRLWAFSSSLVKYNCINRNDPSIKLVYMSLSMWSSVTCIGSHLSHLRWSSVSFKLANLHFQCGQLFLSMWSSVTC